jgi:hypothetical protein
MLTTINKSNNHLSPKESLAGDGQQFSPLSTNQTTTSHLKKVSLVMVNNSTTINKSNNHLSPKESLTGDGQQFHHYQQIKQPPLT